MTAFTALLEILGLGLLVAGAAVLAPFLGLLTAGFVLIFIGWNLEPEAKVNDAPKGDDDPEF